MNCKIVKNAKFDPGSFYKSENSRDDGEKE